MEAGAARGKWRIAHMAPGPRWGRSQIDRQAPPIRFAGRPVACRPLGRAQNTLDLLRKELRPILDAVGFVNRIVFGMYTITNASAFENLDAFYRGAVEQVRKFCERNGIDCHIKKGWQIGHCDANRQSIRNRSI